TRVEKFQQRSHFSPGALPTCTTTGESPCPDPFFTSTAETMKKYRKSFLKRSSTENTGSTATSVTSACRLPPISFWLRASSSAFSTVSRTASTVFQSSACFGSAAIAASFVPSKSAASGKVVRCTLSSLSATSGKYCQTSSQVKLMIGASSRTSAS